MWPVFAILGWIGFFLFLVWWLNRRAADSIECPECGAKRAHRYGCNHWKGPRTR